jgi:hypothetical protein
MRTTGFFFRMPMTVRRSGEITPVCASLLDPEPGQSASVRDHLTGIRDQGNGGRYGCVVR